MRTTPQRVRHQMFAMEMPVA